jgi:cobalt-zinc-cadmium efflux system outer membrane protein
MFPSKITRAGFVVFFAAGSARAQEWTEGAVLALFDRQTPLLRETRASAAAAVEVVRGRTLWPNPVAAYSRETVGFTEFVQAEQSIPLSGRLRRERQALDPARDAAEAQGGARLWDARSSLRAAFYRALAAQKQADVIRSGLAQMNDVIALLRVREQAGEGSRYDRVRVEREAADLRADLALALARAQSERAVMLSYLPLRTEVAVLVGETGARSMRIEREDLIREALNRRAEIRAETSLIAQLRFEELAADRRRIPEPVLTGGMKRTQVLGNQTDTGAVVGIAIPLPLFNKGQTEVARLSAEQARAQARRELLAQQISASVAGAYDVYSARMEALATFDIETRDIGAELLRTARVGFEEGELGILQLLDAYRIDRQTSLRKLELETAVKEIEIELSRVAGYEVIP